MAAAKFEWKKQKYGGAEVLRLADGFVRIYVGWAIVSKDEKGYYEATVNDLRLKAKFQNIEDAKRWALKLAFRLTGEAHEQIKNFLEEE
jgi:hypothetical protein